jgi:hypothetical protein
MLGLHLRLRLDRKVCRTTGKSRAGAPLPDSWGCGGFIYVPENNREWMLSHYKLNDKGDFMSRKKIIMIFNTWLDYRNREPK